jgi:RNA-directed DNA polymerase
MKRTGNIYQNITKYDNIKTAVLKASLGKRDRKYIAKRLRDMDETVKGIMGMLEHQTYVPSPYNVKKILDGANQKERIIYKPRFFPDQIIHWALMLQLQEIIMRGMYQYCCGSVPGRGTSYGQKVLRKWLDGDFRGTKYCLKMDVSKFYPSIDTGALKQMFRDRIKDPQCLWLIDAILDSGDRGLPIGNYTSQWFSNFYLQGLDHFIKETLRAKYYIRYVDDLVILGSNKKILHKMRKEIEAYLNTICLAMNDNWQVFPVRSRAIDFLGLKFYQNRTTLRKRNSLRIRRRFNKIASKPCLSYTDACAVVSYWGWLKRSNSYRFYNEFLKNKVNINQARRRIKQHAKTQLTGAVS